MMIKKHIPNALTLGNLFFGGTGIVMVLENELILGFTFMLIAGLLDFLDGFVARLLKVSSPMGAELDSLADSTTFGLLPAIFMFVTLRTMTDHALIPYFAFFISIMSTYRLAKFNIDTEQTSYFKGVPTPINAIFIASLCTSEKWLSFVNLEILIGITVVTSFLLVSNFPLLALKFKNGGWKENQAKFIFLIMCFGILSLFKENGIVLVFPLYLIISTLHYKLKVI